MKEAGYVYILTNPSFKEDWVKIGKSSCPLYRKGVWGIGNTRDHKKREEQSSSLFL